MSEAKFTKGEWSIGYDNDSSCEWYYTGPAKVEYSYNSTGNEEIEALANAHLISAAPLMYEMLKRLSAKQWDASDEEEIENLLAKARGEK